ncbi:hypothetical protein, partial [Flavobacterium sp.]|uniref:hypothetical protein n=1 Tax=Flavobacterium sp. TaxID=239 RepID=UPI0025BA3490
MKNFFYFLTFYLVSVQLFSQVSVSIIDFRVNNMAVTNNQINFNNASSVNLKFTVKLSTTNGNANNILGNLFIYSKEVLTSDTFVQRDFRAVTFIENNPPFVPETIYTSEYNIEIDLSRSQFYNTGGILYAVYRNSSNNNFFSGNIDIIGGSSINTSPNLLSNSICCNQTIRYGDKPSLITASYIDPDSTFDKKWINVVPGDLPFQNASTNFAVDKVNSYDPGFLFETKTYLRRLGTTGSNFVANQSNQVTITVVPTPIISNNISTNAINIENNIHEINEGQILDFYGTVSKVNLNVLNNPFHIPVRGDDIDFVQFY